MNKPTVTYCEDPNDPDPADMPDFVDFSSGTVERNPHYRHLEGSQQYMRYLAPDLAAMFPDDRSVNQALRQLVELGQAAVEQKHQEPAVEQNPTTNP